MEPLAIETLSPRGARGEVERSARRASRAQRRVALAVATLASALAGAALARSPAAAEPEGARPELDALVRRFAAMPGLSARFEEQKRISLLRAPLESEGTLHYAPPDRIARRIERPSASVWVARGDELLVGSPGQLRTIDLATAPALRPFIEVLRLVLAGDLPELRRRFEIAFEADGGAAGPWLLRLVPREGPLREAVSAIEIRGVGGVLSTLRVLEVGGDETLDRFSDVDPARRFSESELAQIFDVAAP